MYNVISAQKLMRGEKVPWKFPVLAYDFDQKDNQDKESVSSEASSTTTTSRKTSLMILMNSPILGQVSRKKLKINLRKCKTKLRLFNAATATMQVETGNSLNST